MPDPAAQPHGHVHEPINAAQREALLARGYDARVDTWTRAKADKVLRSGRSASRPALDADALAALEADRAADGEPFTRCSACGVKVKIENLRSHQRNRCPEMMMYLLSQQAE